MPLKRKTKRLLKAEEQFKAAVTKYIVGLGAIPGRSYDYEFDTPAGLLLITIYEDWIATRFEDVARGIAFTRTCELSCNPYSGKWNFHFADTLDPETVLPYLDYYFSRLLLWNGAEAK